MEKGGSIAGARIVAALGFLVCSLVVAGHADPAYAQEDTFAPVPTLETSASTAEVHVGLTHTDNVARTPDDRTSDTLAAVGLGLDLHHVGPELDLQSHGSADFIDYLDHSFGSRVLGFVDSAAMYGSPADWFQLTARDTFGQLLVDPFGVAIPSNLENMNLFATGPAVNFHLDDSTRLTAYGIYSRTTYQVSPLDSHALTGGLTLARTLSPFTTVSLNASDLKLEFDNPINPAFSVHTFDVRFDAGTKRTALSAIVGYTQLKDSGQTSGGPLVRLQASRRISAETMVFLSAQRDYATSTDALLSAAGGALGLTSAVGSAAPLATADPFRATSLGAGFEMDKPRTTIKLTTSIREERYQVQSEDDRNVIGFDASVLRRLSSTVTASLTGRVDRERFLNVDGADTESQLTADLTKTIARRTSVALRYQRYSRTGGGLLTSYTENQIGLRAIYAVVGP